MTSPRMPRAKLGPATTARAHRKHAAAIRAQVRAARRRAQALSAVARANREEALVAPSAGARRARETEAALADQLLEVLHTEAAALEAEALRAESAALAAEARSPLGGRQAGAAGGAAARARPRTAGARR